MSPQNHFGITSFQSFFLMYQINLKTCLFNTGQSCKNYKIKNNLKIISLKWNFDDIEVVSTSFVGFFWRGVALHIPSKIIVGRVFWFCYLRLLISFLLLPLTTSQLFQVEIEGLNIHSSFPGWKWVWGAEGQFSFHVDEHLPTFSCSDHHHHQTNKQKNSFIKDSI